MTYALIPGAGGSAWYWHRVAPLLPDAIAIELPAARRFGGPDHLRRHGCRRGVRCVGRPLILVAQSMGAFTAPIVASRVPVASIVLVNPMVPAAGESPGQWWAATGHDQVVPDFDPVEDFFHDVPAAVREEAFRQGEPRQSDTPFGQAVAAGPLARRANQGDPGQRRPAVPAGVSAPGGALAARPGARGDAWRTPDGVEPARGVGVADSVAGTRDSMTDAATFERILRETRTVAIVGASANPCGPATSLELLESA